MWQSFMFGFVIILVGVLASDYTVGTKDKFKFEPGQKVDLEFTLKWNTEITREGYLTLSGQKGNVEITKAHILYKNGTEFYNGTKRFVMEKDSFINIGKSVNIEVEIDGSLYFIGQTNEKIKLKTDGQEFEFKARDKFALLQGNNTKHVLCIKTKDFL